MGARDVPATAQGLADAQAKGVDVRAHGPYRIAISSPLSRAAKTLEVICPPHLNTVFDGRLAERRLGVWEGKEKSVLEHEYPEAFLPSGTLDAMYAFEGGETFDRFSERVASFLDQYQTENVLVVTHNGWIRTARYLTGEIDRESIFAESEPHNHPLMLLQR